MTSQAALGGIASLLKTTVPVDLILTDYSVSDCAEANCNPCGDTYRTVTNVTNQWPKEKKWGIMTEQLILAIRDMQPKALHVAMLAQSRDCLTSSSVAAMRETMFFHNIDVVDLHSTCLIGHFCAVNQFEGNQNHNPPFYTHQEFADYVVGALQEGIRHFQCRGTQPRLIMATGNKISMGLWPLDYRSQVCSKLLTSHNAYAETLTPVQQRTGEWDVCEDELNKPGWIASKPGARHSFKMKFGTEPFLVVEYGPVSEKALGSAIMRVKGQPDTDWTINGIWDHRANERLSDGFTAWYHVSDRRREGGGSDKDDIEIGPGYGIKPHSEVEIEFEYAGNEEQHFKLISISSC
eukprot:CAMPEP_0170187662 /NCGR_PEP_ID=MMETSP0040_2-20121228/42280_1 /TAXON_ID=641309 /ORGANISM="Lotharella oceanica, Strain CCMP622" /LENGTH=349 /DNA_ID=CAMNT_0010434753 /DNA_START=677 /DNA_END=1726 /DNA_ORIENTATION=-